MWTRALSEATGMERDDFTKAIIEAFQNKSVVDTIKEAIANDLLKEINELKTLVKEKDEKIKDLKEKVSSLECKTDDLEQYSRRNSLRIYGIQEKEFEDSVETTLTMFKSEMDLDLQPSALDRVSTVLEGRMTVKKANPCWSNLPRIAIGSRSTGLCHD